MASRVYTISSDDLIRIRVMNKHVGDLPWSLDDIDDDLDLSEGSGVDLMTFVSQRDAADPEVTDVRWTGIPVMHILVSAEYALADSCARPLSEQRRPRTRACVAPAKPSQFAFRTNSTWTGKWVSSRIVISPTRLTVCCGERWLPIW